MGVEYIGTRYSVVSETAQGNPSRLWRIRAEIGVRVDAYHDEVLSISMSRRNGLDSIPFTWFVLEEVQALEISFGELP